MLSFGLWVEIFAVIPLSSVILMNDIFVSLLPASEFDNGKGYSSHRIIRENKSLKKLIDTVFPDYSIPYAISENRKMDEILMIAENLAVLLYSRYYCPRCA